MAIFLTTYSDDAALKADMEYKLQELLWKQVNGSEKRNKTSTGRRHYMRFLTIERAQHLNYK